ncbi:c-type cytochrome [Marinicaulis aureus]|uniref:C-type cytochrome n=1 Tax=Hyphococcus aureus TaxID=2666033 RepID=A0ABW1KRF8_9PROT
MRILIIIAAILIAAPLLGLGGVYFVSEAKLRDVTYDPAFEAPIPTDAASIEHGRHIARTRGCFGCHGQQLQGKDFDEQWDWPERAVAPNLALYAREHDVATLEAAIRQGIGANGKGLVSMPSYNFARLTDEDLAALIAFLRSAPVVEIDLPKPKLGWIARWSFATGEETHYEEWADHVPALRVDPEAEPQRALGEYLAMTMCNECHGLDLRGATLWDAVTPDLIIVSAYSRDEFEKLITTGVAMSGRELGLMRLVAPDRFPELSKEEIDALYLHLTALADEPVPEGVFWRP